ncbi:protein trichome birefringence-like 16 [Phtheirospermum japonicum]|uniref:Protein trichome birefringence-like 16 n=1 Tax=Phtheirospermum japonicum TaxID=374723 RepID=A0A830AZ44_9LAMI|nr:protein trichome birefringence-like 16 [Phtheirospermum japonicum]
MKGGIQGLKVSQVSLILIGLVCVTVLAFAWTKTTFLTSFVPSQSRVLQLDLDTAAGPRDTLGGNKNSAQSWTNQIDSLSSSGISGRENIENATTNDGGETPDTILEKIDSEEVSQRKNISKQQGIVPENSPTVELSVKSELMGNSPASTGKKGNSPVIERTGSEEVSQKKNKSKQADIVPASSLTKESSIKAEQTTNLSAIAGKKECNYAKGKWVLDDNRPLYFGSGCKQWLSSMWACRLTQRTDFEYEKLRWQPKGCKRDDFTGSKFLERYI